MEETELPHYYFAYGSNLSLEQMQARCPDARFFSVAHLSGYRLAFGGFSQTRGGGVATIRPDHKGGRTAGVLFEMTPDDWRKLDVYEGYPSIYRREVVQVFNPAGWPIQAQVYIRNQFDAKAPAPAYRRIIEYGYKFHCLPIPQLQLALAECQRA